MRTRRSSATAWRSSSTAPGTPPRSVPAVDSLETEIDRLYALEPEAFVAERDRVARELRTAGRREDADEVKALRKPTASAWTINQLARRERRAVDLLLDAGHRLADAQRGVLAGGDRGSLDDARRGEREAVATLRRAAREILAQAGRGSDATLNQIVATLQVAAVSAEGRELLARGRLTGDLEATGFELLAPLAEGAPPPPAKAPPRRARPEPKAKPAAAPTQAARQRERQAERARQQEARKRLVEARNLLREARAAAKTAEQELRAAEQEADKARAALARSEARVDERETAAAAARQAVAEAEQALADAERDTKPK